MNSGNKEIGRITYFNKASEAYKVIKEDMDRLDRKIIRALHRDGRMTAKALSQLVGLSQPSIAERIKRLMETGALRFTIAADPKSLGYPITAIVRISPLPGELNRVEALIAKLPEVTQCDKVTGQDAFFCRLHLKDIGDLDVILSKVSQFATTNTSIVKSSPVEARLPPLDAEVVND
ncbi:Lrp/AsnC family transcriptional regulator [Fulvimarina sp. 2208YS6-2-32]|uniref:Lrp/AsnC family transcriptional regulator n=1 Tax=Fulvimarina uroteuthidis TaxID=3098149 RepID=A0ABU5I2T4_9HYPH|nr:Lrp/AsnC family transcriptional regulator [Fulvimarina sp. 2208YS6-2-32]MDY8109278.1 Lrp/AsnC family transcriptional regulator [Fulvimarina sp. 2208YS6-2-32]